jgi:hypothetical protein
MKHSFFDSLNLFWNKKINRLFVYADILCIAGSQIGILFILLLFPVNIFLLFKLLNAIVYYEEERNKPSFNDFELTPFFQISLNERFIKPAKFFLASLSKAYKIGLSIFSVVFILLPIYFIFIHATLVFSVNSYLRNTNYFIEFLDKQFKKGATDHFNESNIVRAIDIILTDTTEIGTNGRNVLEKAYFTYSGSLTSSKQYYILRAFNSKGLLFEDKFSSLKEYILGNNNHLYKMVDAFSKKELTSHLNPILLETYDKTEGDSTLIAAFHNIQLLTVFRKDPMIKLVINEYSALETLKNQLSDLNSNYESTLTRIEEIRPPLPKRPDKIEYQWMSGYIVRQLNEPLAYEISLYDGESAVLKTVETVFSTAGNFSLYTKLFDKGFTRDRNNFTQVFNIYIEVPKSTVEEFENSLVQYEKDFEYANNWESMVKDDWIINLFRESKQLPKTIAIRHKEVALQEYKLKTAVKAFINSLGQVNTTNQDNELPKTVIITNSKIRQIDFNNFTYQIHGTKESITVKEGQSLTPIPGFNSSSIFDILDIAYGDVNSDGIEDAAIMTYSGESTASARTQDLYIYTLRNNRPQVIGFISNNEMFESLEKKIKPNLSNWFRWVSFNEVDIIDNKISVSWRYAESAKPRFITTLYRWNGNSLDAVR